MGVWPADARARNGAHTHRKGAGTAGGITLPLPPIAVSDVPWWRDDVRPGLPRVRADSLLERWPRGGIELAARYDTAFGGTFATLPQDTRASI